MPLISPNFDVKAILARGLFHKIAGKNSAIDSNSSGLGQKVQFMMDSSFIAALSC